MTKGVAVLWQETSQNETVTQTKNSYDGYTLFLCPVLNLVNKNGIFCCLIHLLETESSACSQDYIVWQWNSLSISCCRKKSTETVRKEDELLVNLDNDDLSWVVLWILSRHICIISQTVTCSQLLAAHVQYGSIKSNQIGNCVYVYSDHQEIPTGGRLWHLIPSQW